MSKEFGTRLDGLLKGKNMSQAELAKMLGIDASSISYYVSGKRTPTTKYIARMAEVLETTVDYLLGNTGTNLTTNRVHDITLAKSIIEKYANTLTKSEKLEIISLLIGDD